LTARHLTGGSVLSLATIEVPDFQGDHLPYHRHGRIVRDGFGHIADIVEYADADDGQRALTELNPSIFCFDTNWLWPALERIEAGNSQNELYLTDLVKIAAADGVRIAEIAIPAIEGRGVNSRRDLALVEARLPRGSASHASGAMYRPVSRDAETMSRHRLAHAPKAAGSRTGS
jgi:bifunctional UDP-N-acetylglucosamine pyrophosphorylase/glucosamine-1-phosphate N-acetyltransferase